MGLKRVGDLEIGEDIAHQETMWKVERAGWILMALLLIAALLGLLGPGPLSNATASDPGSLIRVEYERFVRHQAPVELRIHLGSASVHDGRVRLWLNREFITRAQIERIDPEPERTELDSHRFVYVLDTPKMEESSQAIIHFKPAGFGLTRVQLGLVGGPEVEFKQWVYP
jgi:hypothetical protein